MHTKFLPYLAVLGAVAFWGGSFAAMKLAVSAMGPWAVMWLRMLVALAVLAPVLKRLTPTQGRPGDWRLLAPMALCMPCGYFLLESYALTFTSSAQAGVVSATVPLLVAAGARLFLGERVSAGAMAGLTLSLLGVAWLTLAGSADEHAPAPLLGNLLELGAMVCAAAYMLIAKQLSSRYNPWTLTALQTLVGAVFFVPGIWGL